MRKKGKAALVNTKSGNERECIRGDLHNISTQTKTTQGFIESFLRRGAENAMSSKVLLELTGLDLRNLRKAVETERRNGTLILTGYNCGYFLPDEGEKGKQEILQFYHLQRAKALSLLKTIAAARKALEVIDGQEELDI